MDETLITAAFIDRFTDWTGLEVSARRETFIRCLRERAADTGFPSLSAYIAHVTSPAHAEIGRLVNALMIGYSWLFRDLVQMQLVVSLLAERPSRAARARVWVAGCATGEDVYTLALLAGKQPLDILGTDVNQHALAVAAQGCYLAAVLRVVPSEFQRFFRRQGSSVMIEDTIRQSVRFATHNLMDPAPAPPAGSSWDVIVCRNVLIHFSPERRLVALRHLSAALPPGGFLLLGAGESPPFSSGLQRIDRDGYCVLHRSAEASPARESNRVPAVAPLLSSPARASERMPAILPSIPSPARASERVATILPSVSAGPDTLSSPVPANGAAAPLQTAAEQLQRGLFDAAIATSKTILQHEPLCAEALLLGGVAWQLSGRDGEAVTALQQALFLRPELWPAAFYLALSLERIGQVEAASAAYQWVVRESQHPRFDEPPVLALLGITAWRAELVLAAKARGHTLGQSAAAG